MATVLAAGCLVAGLAAAPAGAATPAAAGVAAHAHAATRTPIRVGSLLLRPCSVVAGAYCGSLKQPWDPSGAVPGQVGVGFAFVPAGDRSAPLLGTVVPHEGGPGYSTTGSAQSYADMYGPLLRPSQPARSSTSAAPAGPPRSTARACRTGHRRVRPGRGRVRQALGDHADLYGSALSADDLAAVVRPSASAGSTCTATRTARSSRRCSPDGTRTCCAAWSWTRPTPRTARTPGTPTQGPAMVRSIDLVCARTPVVRGVRRPHVDAAGTGARAGARDAPYAGVGVRRRRDPAPRGRGRGRPGRAGVRRDLRAGLVPRAARRPALRARRRPRTAAPARRRGGLRLAADAGDPVDYSEGPTPRSRATTTRSCTT